MVSVWEVSLNSQFPFQNWLRTTFNNVPNVTLTCALRGSSETEFLLALMMSPQWRVSLDHKWSDKRMETHWEASPAGRDQKHGLSETPAVLVIHSTQCNTVNCGTAATAAAFHVAINKKEKVVWNDLPNHTIDLQHCSPLDQSLGWR